MEPRPYFDKQWLQFNMVEALKTVIVLNPLHHRQHIILQAVIDVTAKIKVEISQSTCDNSRIFGIVMGTNLKAPMLLNFQNS